jgi:ubiquinone/menaquinone biosynthesis C-methylase UbiE
MADVSWLERQRHCDSWYQQISAEKNLYQRFTEDYAPYASALSAAAGDVLDVGGGCGFASRYLTAAKSYTVAEPSAQWLDPVWRCVSPSRPPFVLAMGEALPFQSERFDSVISMWSLNHAAQPENMTTEMGRVLRRGGTLLIALEETEPRWTDLFRSDFLRLGARKALRNTVYRKVVQPILGRHWKLIFDHLDIKEPALISWLPNFTVVERKWFSDCLCLVFRKN